MDLPQTEIIHEQAAHFVRIQGESLQRAAIEYLAVLALRGRFRDINMRNKDVIEKFNDDANNLSITVNDEASESTQKALIDFFSEKNKVYGVKEKDFIGLQKIFHNVKKNIGRYENINSWSR